jgi:hypothetical protein
MGLVNDATVYPNSADVSLTMLNRSLGVLSHFRRIILAEIGRLGVIAATVLLSARAGDGEID